MGAPSSTRKPRNQEANLFRKEGRWGVRIKLPFAVYGRLEYKRLIGTKGEAQDERDRVKRLIRLRQPLEPAAVASHLLGDLMREARLAWKKRDPRYRYSELWIEWGGTKPIHSISRPRLQEAFRTLAESFSAATVRIAVSALKAAFSLAIQQGLMARDRSPFAEPFDLAPGNERNSPIPPEKLVALFEAAGPRWAPTLEFLVLSGLRIGELLGLEWARVDLAGRFLTISKPKQKKPHVLHLSARMVEILLEQKRLGSRWCFPGARGGRLTYSGWNNKRIPWYRAAGIYKLHTTHDSRHTAATLAASSGQSLLAIGRMLGQRNPNTTKRYAHILEQAARGTVEAVASRLAEQIEKN